MAVCRSCYEQFAASDLDDRSHCPACAEHRQKIRAQLGSDIVPQPAAPRYPNPEDRQKALRRIALTTETFVGPIIEQRLGIVSSEAVVGMNLFRDIMVEVRDIVGGRSKAAQNAMRDIKQALFDDLQQQTHHLGGNMVVAVSLNFREFGSRGSAILATAAGTAVRVSKSSAEDL